MLQLIVVVSTLAQGRPALAIGNIVGSAISNILGAFSLGLFFRKRDVPAHFDRSSKIYSALLLIITTLVMPVTRLPQGPASIALGGSLIAVFTIYVISIGWSISRGAVSAPEDSDSDSDSESDSDDDADVESAAPQETDALLSRPKPARRPRRSLLYHVGQLIFGFLQICLAGYVLPPAAINIADAWGVSDFLFGVVFLAIATTLPEKFIAMISGHRGHVGILTANTAGSNIFLLSLCLGIVFVDARTEPSNGNVKAIELGILWLSTAVFTLTVWFGGRFDRWLGLLMLLGYITFIALEFVVIR